MSKRQLSLSSFFGSPSADETDQTAEMTDDDTTHDATDDIENLPTDHTARVLQPHHVDQNAKDTPQQPRMIRPPKLISRHMLNIV